MSNNEGELTFPCLKVTQPIGDFFIGSIDSSTLCEITYNDVRRIEREHRDVETYLGVQRPLDNKRVKELTQYVRTVDACFPTAVILAVEARCAHFDEERRIMTLLEVTADGDDETPIGRNQIAKVLDGQHRIEGLREYDGPVFQVNVAIFVDIDLAEQAYIFSTVNLAQTKVNKSLVYDLFSLARSRSPQKLAHNVAVALDSHEESPFYQRIKRLGVSTEGRFGETITQAAFVQALMRYLTDDEIRDRDIYLRGKVPPKISADQLQKRPFQHMMVDQRDAELTDVIWNYFAAVRDRWPAAWNAGGRGIILNKTNGFRALMRFFREAYLHLVAPGEVPEKEQFAEIFGRINLVDDDFNTNNFKPGTSGEAELYWTLKSESQI